MNQINDPKLIFYFRNQQMIDEWAALASQIPEQCHAFLSSLVPDVEKLAKDLGAEPSINTGTDYPKLFLSKPTWHRNGAKVAIGLEWVRRTVSFRDNRCTYVGVDQFHPDGPKLSADLQRGFSTLPVGYSSLNWWPARRFEGARYDNFWANLQPYRTSLLDSIAEVWKRFATTIEQVV